MCEGLTCTMATIGSVVDNASFSTKSSTVVPPQLEKEGHWNEQHGRIEFSMFGYP